MEARTGEHVGTAALDRGGQAIHRVLGVPAHGPAGLLFALGKSTRRAWPSPFVLRWGRGEVRSFRSVDVRLRCGLLRRLRDWARSGFAQRLIKATS